VLRNQTKALRINPLDSYAWFLFAVASYALCLLSFESALGETHSTAGVLEHVLDLHTKEWTWLDSALARLHSARKDPKVEPVGRQRDEEEALLRRIRVMEDKLFFLRMALSDCCLLKGTEGMPLATEALSSTSSSPLALSNCDYSSPSWQAAGRAKPRSTLRPSITDN